MTRSGKSPDGDGSTSDPGARELARHAAEFTDIDVDAIEEQERIASRRKAAIEAGRRKGGIPGAAMAGAMVAVGEIYEGPPKDDAPVVVEAPGEPGDIDVDGIEASVGDVDVWAPPPLNRDDPPDNGVRI